jgi:hypothetical protein
VEKAVVVVLVHMKASHHAVVFEGDAEPALIAARAYVEEVLGMSLVRNPDLSFLTLPRLTIEEARTLKEDASQQPLGHVRAFVIVCDTILVEAQNALLKILEEPSERTHFVLVLPTVETLLPTVRSRLHHAGRFMSENVEYVEAKNFLKASYKERMKMIEDVLEDKDRVKARTLITSLLSLMHEDGAGKNVEALKDLALTADYIQDRSSSVKYLLQHIAVTL